MKLSDIHIRDPFVFADEGKYYLYGTRAHKSEKIPSGLDVYVSEDLENWSGPKEAFTRPEDFWATKDFWAPEVHKYNGEYYMFVSFKSDDRERGTQILKAPSPMGPFLVHSDGPVTPSNWSCLDGTFYVENSKPYMVFCHEWSQVEDGEMCAIELTSDLKAPVGEPVVLFHASEPSWSDGYQPGKYVTDGPFIYKAKNGRLVMIWSSFSKHEYCEGLAYSENGSILGPWTHDDRMLFEKDGGHGMIFSTYEGQLKFVFHQPNCSPDERPHLLDLFERENSLYTTK